MPDVGEGLTEAEILTWHVAAGRRGDGQPDHRRDRDGQGRGRAALPWAGTVGELLAAARARRSRWARRSSPSRPSRRRLRRVRRRRRGTGRRGRRAARRSARPAPTAGSPPWSATARAPARSTRRPRRGPTRRAAARRSGAAATGEPDTGPDRPCQPRRRDRRGTAAAGAAGQAAGAQAGPGPRRRPAGGDRHRAGGVITREDVEALARRRQREPAPARSAPAASPGGERREPIRGRPQGHRGGHGGQRVHRAARDRVPGRRRHRDDGAARPGCEPPASSPSVKLTPLAFVAKAVCLAARRTPEVNAHWDEAAGEIVYYDRVQLGHRRGHPARADRAQDPRRRHARRCASWPSPSASSPPPPGPAGPRRPTWSAAPSRSPTSACSGWTPARRSSTRARRRSWPSARSSRRPGWWTASWRCARSCQLALSFDHRLVDGEQGSRFLADVGALLTDPGLALTW